MVGGRPTAPSRVPLYGPAPPAIRELAWEGVTPWIWDGEGPCAPLSQESPNF